MLVEELQRGRPTGARLAVAHRLAVKLMTGANSLVEELSQISSAQVLPVCSPSALVWTSRCAPPIAQGIAVE